MTGTKNENNLLILPHGIVLTPDTRLRLLDSFPFQQEIQPNPRCVWLLSRSDSENQKRAGLLIWNSFEKKMFVNAQFQNRNRPDNGP